jgi:hypothetical protein
MDELGILLVDADDPSPRLWQGRQTSLLTTASSLNFLGAPSADDIILSNLPFANSFLELALPLLTPVEIPMYHIESLP